MLWIALALLNGAEAATALEKVLMVLGGGSNLTAAQWNEMTILERITAYDWSKEMMIAATIIVYVLTHFYGVNANKKRVDAFVDAVSPVLEQQFAVVGCTPETKVAKDSCTRYATYATGRENIAHIHAQMTLIDRHNIILQFIGLFVPSFRSLEGVRDLVEIVITPHDPAAIPPFICSTVSKYEMQPLRDENYFLSLTRTTESSKIPQSLVFMSEHNDLTDAVFHSELLEAVNAGESVLEYFAITDQPKNYPEAITGFAPKPTIRLGLRYPSNSAEKKAVADLVNCAIRAVDDLVAKKITVKPEWARKIKITREEQIKKMEKAQEAVRLQELEAKKAEEKREAQRNISKLSEKEQRKIAKKQQEKEQRKMRSRQSQRA